MGMLSPLVHLVILPALCTQPVHQWTVQRGGSHGDEGAALQVDASGNAWVAGGYTYSSLDGHIHAGFGDVFLMKFDHAGVHQWTVQRGGSSVEYGTALEVDASGNSWVAGYTYSSLDGHTNAGESDVFLMKFDTTGVHQWTVQRGGLGEDEAKALQVDASGNAWVAGWTKSSLDGNAHVRNKYSNIFLMKFDHAGVHQWTVQPGDSRSAGGKALEVDASGNAWVAGWTYSSLDSPIHYVDILLMKFDHAGVHQWTVQRGGSGDDEPTALQVDASGNACVAGYTRSSLDGHTNAGGQDVFLMKFDTTGVHQWTVQRGGLGDDEAKALQVDASGNAWVAGRTLSSLDGHTNAGRYDVFLMQFDHAGIHQWTVQRGGSLNDEAYALQVDASGNAWVAGYTYSSLDGHINAGSGDVFLMKFDHAGVHQWTVQRGGSSDEYGKALEVDASGNAWVAGWTKSSLDGHTNAGASDVFLMKFQAASTVTAARTTTSRSVLPSTSKTSTSCSTTSTSTVSRSTSVTTSVVSSTRTATSTTESSATMFKPLSDVDWQASTMDTVELDQLVQKLLISSTLTLL